MRNAGKQGWAQKRYRNNVLWFVKKNYRTWFYNQRSVLVQLLSWCQVKIKISKFSKSKCQGNTKFQLPSNSKTCISNLNTFVLTLLSKQVITLFLSHSGVARSYSSYLLQLPALRSLSIRSSSSGKNSRHPWIPSFLSSCEHGSALWGTNVHYYGMRES